MSLAQDLAENIHKVFPPRQAEALNRLIEDIDNELAHKANSRHSHKKLQEAIEKADQE